MQEDRTLWPEFFRAAPECYSREHEWNSYLSRTVDKVHTDRVAGRSRYLPTRVPQSAGSTFRTRFAQELKRTGTLIGAKAPRQTAGSITGSSPTKGDEMTFTNRFAMELRRSGVGSPGGGRDHITAGSAGGTPQASLSFADEFVRDLKRNNVTPQPKRGRTITSGSIWTHSSVTTSITL